MNLEQAITDTVHQAVTAALNNHTPRLAYTVAEAAHALHVSPDTIRQLIHNQHLPVVPHIGRRQLIPVQALEQFAVSAAAPTAEPSPSTSAVGATGLTAA